MTGGDSTVTALWIALTMIGWAALTRSEVEVDPAAGLIVTVLLAAVLVGFLGHIGSGRRARQQ